jgi:hypothetical protein
MIKYGFEQEFFLLDKNDKPVMVPAGIAKDECGFLVEARGEPHSDPIKAAYLLLAETNRLQVQCGLLGYKMQAIDSIKLDRAFVRQALRMHGKPAYSDERNNLYNKDYKASDTLARAGLHVHFSHQFEDYDSTYNKYANKISVQLNIPRIVRFLDETFAPSIKEAKRVPGFYEMKQWGFEYRSLPTSLPALYVAQAIEKNKRIFALGY